jgi:hypothetical protein
LAFFTRLWGITRPFWSDELITLNTLKAPIFQNPLLYGFTTNLPLFFWVLRIWNPLALLLSSFLQVISSSPSSTLLLISYRLLPITFGICTLILTHWFLKKIHLLSLFLPFSLIFTFAPIQILYAQELRPYSLVQFLLIAQFFFLYLYLLEGRKKYLVIHSILILLALFTHYCAYMFYFCQMLLIYGFLIRKHKLDKFIIFSNSLAFLVGIALYYLMSRGPYFADSIKGETVLGNFSLFEGISRIKEVVVLYYYYGLEYYYVSPMIQFVLKKLLLVFFLLIPFFSWKRKNLFILFSFLTLVFSLFLALSMEYFGLYPFGGRHIMAFSPLLYMGIAYVIQELLSQKRSLIKLFVEVFFVILIGLFAFHQYVITNCSISKDIKHAEIYEMCLLQLFR